MSSFSLDLKKYANKIEKDAIRTAGQITVTALQGVISKTPRDTGRAQSNWNVAPLKADLTTTEATSPPANAKSRATNAATVALKAGGDIYIANNLPYIRRLEYGHSQQSKAMVRRTIEEVKAEYNL